MMADSVYEHRLNCEREPQKEIFPMAHENHIFSSNQLLEDNDTEGTIVKDEIEVERIQTVQHFYFIAV